MNMLMLWFKRFHYITRMILCVLVAFGITACASMQLEPNVEAERLASEARIVLLNFLRDPNQTWIQQNLNRARGVLIAPQVVRAGFIVGGSGGRAVLVATRRPHMGRSCVLRSRHRERRISRPAWTYPRR